MPKYDFEKFAPDFLSLLDAIDESHILTSDSNEDNKSDIQKSLKDIISEYDEDYFSYELAREAMRCTTNELPNYLNSYFDEMSKYYTECESAAYYNPHFRPFDAFFPHVLYLCWKYFQSINEKTKANESYFYILCYFADEYIDFPHIEWLPFICNDFDIVKDFIHADWLAFHPIITWSIGSYYLYENNPKKAFEFFSLGASLDYYGRQTMMPFVRVALNKYELGMLYLKGLGVKQDYSLAMEYFQNTAEDIGEGSLPIIGDMYYEGLGVKQDFNKAFDCYCEYNKYNLDIELYFKNLNEIQKDRLHDLLEDSISGHSLSFDEFMWVSDIYKYRLNDLETAKDYKNLGTCLAIDTPVEQRTEAMDMVYIDYALSTLKKKTVAPTINTGKIPSNLKVGDLFTFGIFNNEPIEWKVLEINDNTIFVVTSKIIVKMTYSNVAKWLNTNFLNGSFTEEEKSHISHAYYSDFFYDKTYFYLPTQRQFTTLEGTYPKGTIKQTEFAKSLSKIDKVLCLSGKSVLSDGNESRIISVDTIGGVRPAMDILINVPKE